MSLGFQNAGFEIVAGFECWDSAIACYKNNFIHPVEKVDLSNVNQSIQVMQKYNFDVIIGGPPCQDFSVAGRRQEGERADLTVCYAKIIQKLSPAFFVMENVERATKSVAYLQAKQIFKDSGYGLTEKVLDASFCGVPQKRKRFFCIGAKGEEDQFLSAFLSANQSIFPLTVRKYFLNQCIPLEIEYYYRHPRTYGRRAIFSVDEPSPTVRGVNRPKPAGYKKHPGDPCSPTDIRALTYKERAFIQTFPSNFIWNDSNSVVEQMIGNAVPVNLASYVATALLDFCSGKNNNMNMEFIEWLQKAHNYKYPAAKDTVSRIRRCNNIVPIANSSFENYMTVLEKAENFQNLSQTIRSQLCRSIFLFYEYKNALHQK